MALSRTRRQREVGGGEGGDAGGGGGGDSRDRNDHKTRESGGGKVEERKVDFAAQCQDPKNNNPVFFLLSEWGLWGGGGFLSFSANG